MLLCTAQIPVTEGRSGATLHQIPNREGRGCSLQLCLRRLASHPTQPTAHFQLDSYQMLKVSEIKSSNFSWELNLSQGKTGH